MLEFRWTVGGGKHTCLYGDEARLNAHDYTVPGLPADAVKLCDDLLRYR